MTRDELVKVHTEVHGLVTELERLGDYDVSARFIRTLAKALLQIIAYLLSRMRSP